MIRQTFLILTLIAVAAVILFTRSHQPNQSSRSADAEAPLQPGYFMTDASIVQTGPDGLPMYRMRADRIQQNPANMTVRLRHLELDYRVATPDGVARNWTLTARQGDMPQTAGHINLSGNVEIVGQPLPGQPPARIRTQKLSVDTQTETVRTAEPVEFIWGESRLSGTGLKADLKAERIQLESKIHGRANR